MRALVGIWNTNVSQYWGTLEWSLTALRSALVRMNTAMNSAKIPPGSLIKSIFVAPEYLVAKPEIEAWGWHRAVSEVEKDRAVLEFQKLSRLYPRMLIVPGSIAWYRDLDAAQARRDLNYYQYVNVNPWHKQVALQKTADLPNRSRMMRNTTWALLNGQVRFLYNKQGDFNEVVGTNKNTIFIPGGRRGVCDIENLRIGFEICLDHNLGMLASELRPDKDPPHIHIVCSAWVKNNSANMAVRHGGYYVHASTAATQGGVWKWDGLARTWTQASATGGGDMWFFEIDVHTEDDDDLFATVVGHAEWMTGTWRDWHFRSSQLRALDAALKSYEDSEYMDLAKLGALRTAFEAWYADNPKEATKRNKNDVVQRLKKQLSL